MARAVFDIDHKIFFDPPSKVMKIKTKVNRGDLKAFAQQRKTYMRLEDNPKNGRKYLQIKQIRGLIFKIYK